MCVAIACKDKLPTADVLNAAQNTNRDGGGAAWIEDGAVAWEKNIDAKRIYELMEEKRLKAPCLIHFRIATAGGTRPELCHPFPISKNVSTDVKGTASEVMIHNGHWSDWSAKVLYAGMAIKNVPQGHWSDSRAMAFLGHVYGPGVFPLMEGQKVATLDKTGAIKTYGYFSEKDGVWYSNLHWDSHTPSQYLLGGNYSDEEWERRFDNGDWEKTGNGVYVKKKRKTNPFFQDYTKKERDGIKAGMKKTYEFVSLWGKRPKEMTDKELEELVDVRQDYMRAGSDPSDPPTTNFRLWLKEYEMATILEDAEIDKIEIVRQEGLVADA